MAYIPNVWSSADLITAAKMNHIEDGIASSTARARTITVQTNQWILNSTTNMYEYTVGFENIDEASWIEVNLDETISNISENIRWETSNESIVFSTIIRPSGVVNITIVAWGTTEGGAGSSVGVIKSEGIYPTYVGELSNLNKNCIVNASGANDLPNNNSTTFTVVTHYKNSNEKVQIAFAPGGKEVYMRTATNGTYSNWVLIGTEIIDNLTTNDSTKTLSAKQGKTLKDDLDALNELITRDAVDVSALASDAWVKTAMEGEYVTVGSSLSGTFLDGADHISGALTLKRTGTFDGVGYGFIMFHTANNTLYARTFHFNASSVTWHGTLQKIATNSDLANKLNTPRARKYILLGDSYMGLGLGSQIVAQTGITATIFSAGGGGFVGKGKDGGYTFLTGLQEATKNFTEAQKNEITDVYVLGGYNDYNEAATAIADAMSIFHAYVASAFPNATITLGVIAFSKHEADLGLIDLKVIPTYKNQARALCWKYIPNANAPIHYPDAISDDEVHPVSTQGIADYVSQFIMRGGTSYSNVMNSVATPYLVPPYSVDDDTNTFLNGTALHLQTRINDGVCMIIHENDERLEFAKPYNFSNSLDTDSRTTCFSYNGFARGVLYGHLSGACTIAVPIVSTVWINNAYEDCDGMLYFAYGYIGVAFKRRYVPGQQRTTFNSSSFNIPPFVVTVPLELC